MRNGMWTIIKKELARFFGDKRMAVTTILLPGLLIYVVYTFMGSAMSDMFTVEEDYAPTIAVVNLPASVESVAKAASLKLESVEPARLETVKKHITEQEQDLCMVFPENFDAAVAAYQPTSGQDAPLVEMFYNSASTTSQEAYTLMAELLDQYESTLSNKFDINRSGEGYDLASSEDTAGMFFASMMPMLLMIFLFSGCMSVAPESIAGEKERGTMATLLITPLKRSHLALGKIIALAVISLLSGISSTTGTILALPKLMGAASDQMNVSVYSITDYLLLGVVILSTVLLLVTLISLISAFARTIKEAQTAVMPFMILTMLVGVTAMFSGSAQANTAYYCIPLYNSVQSMVGIFSFDSSAIHITTTVVSNLLWVGIGVFVLTKMFNSEKIVFSK